MYGVRVNTAVLNRLVTDTAKVSRMNYDISPRKRRHQQHRGPIPAVSNTTNPDNPPPPLPVPTNLYTMIVSPMESVCFICNTGYWTTMLDPHGPSQASTVRILSFCDLFGIKDGTERQELLRLSYFADPFCSPCCHKMNQLQDWIAQLELLQKGIENLKSDVGQLMIQTLPHSRNVQGLFPLKARIVRTLQPPETDVDCQPFNDLVTLPPPTDNTISPNTSTTNPEFDSQLNREIQDDEGHERDDNPFHDNGDSNSDISESDIPISAPEVAAPKPKQDKSKPPRRAPKRIGPGEKIEAHEDGRCRLCPSTFKSKIQLWKHIKRKHSGIRHVCRYCDKEFGDTSNRNKHERSVHEISSRDVICEQCGKDYKTMDDLRYHTRIVHEGFVTNLRRKVPSQCQECGVVCSSKGNLAKHIRIKHRGDLERKVCPICGRPFRNSSQLSLHKRTHMSAKELKDYKGITKYYKCPICPLEDQLGFRNKIQLREHYNQEHPEGNKDQLIAASKKPRKYKSKAFCPECPHLAPFHWKSLLAAHIASGHKEYFVARPGKVCRVCTKRLNYPSAARRHEESHHPQLHVCEFCPFTHPETSGMEGHYGLAHSERPMPRIPPLIKVEDTSRQRNSKTMFSDTPSQISESEMDSEDDSESDLDLNINCEQEASHCYTSRGRLMNPSKYQEKEAVNEIFDAIGITHEVLIKVERIDDF